MKILGIRGKNLASLAGDFEVDFLQEPLASAGLFAISGPTGAGKSTLLDALCLALYDATPRLLRAGSKGIGLPDVRDETVTPQDTRTLLRRGASDGFAEVDFIGADGIHYRARWSVRRSRNKADGALQQVAMSLRQLPELVPIGGTNREIKAEIEKRIGLNFDQFTRAVLLAQNEFSAFLKADDGERGELLQTLTGTAVYTEVSKRAYERAKLEQAALDKLTSRLADHKPLAQEERAQLERDSALADGALAEIDRRKSALDEQLRWHQEWQRMLDTEKQAEQECAQHRMAQAAATPRRAHLACVESVQPARPLLADRERTGGDTERCRQALSEAEASAAQAESGWREAQQSLEQALQSMRDAERAVAAAAPELDRAKLLDAQIEALLPAHADIASRQTELLATEEHARASLQANDALRAQLLQQRDACTAWLDRHAHLRSLADGWPRWDTLLGQAARAASEEDRSEQTLTLARQGALETKEQAIRAASQADAAGEALANASRRLETAVAALARLSSSGLLARRQSADARRELLDAAERLWRTLSSGLAISIELEAEIGKLQLALDQSTSRLADIDMQLPLAETALAQAERSLKTAETACAESVEQLRAALEENAPCPVCGATDHPYASANPQWHSMLGALQSEVDRCRLQVRQLLQQRAAQIALSGEAGKQLQDLAGKQRKAIDAIRTCTQAYEAHPVAAEIAGMVHDQRTAWFDDQQRLLRGELETIAADEQAIRAATAACDLARQEVDDASKRHASQKDAAVAVQAAKERMDAEQAVAAGRKDEIAARLHDTLSQLDAAFAGPDWRAAWQAAPEQFHASHKTQIDEWLARCQTCADCEKKMGTLDVEHAALAGAAANAALEARRATDTLSASATRLEEKQAARRNLFGGKPVAQVQSELHAATETAKGRHAALSQALQERGTARARCIEALEQSRQRLTAALSAAGSADAAIAAWISDYNKRHADPSLPIGIERLIALLSHTPDWIADERRQLQAIDAALETAQTVLQERATRRQRHDAQRPAADGIEAVATALENAVAERQAAHTHATAFKLALAQDDARRRQSQAMTAEIAQQEAAAQRWGRLSELIGSHDGKKFRNYAQQFTLDLLLGYANRHLSDLARRYRLERIRDSLALMVVDQDMGDEMRSVHSLSGGESFLVSLALALGLASLSSNRVRVESLFIDEGFGSLDADTLSVAMNALDNLQAMGRKVGVISHVQEMTERIATRIQVQKTTGGKSRLFVEQA